MNAAPHTDVLVTGATGLLGTALVRALAVVPNARVVATSRRAPPWANLDVTWEALDLADRAATRRLVERVRPRAIVHAAVATRAEDLGPIIVDASGELAGAAQAVGAAFVHVSSDMVFDGAHGPFAEDAPLSPITPYGAAKATAERRVREAHPEAWIVRSSLLYALHPLDRSLAAWLAGLDAGTAYPLFTDEIRCPAPVDDVAAAMVRLVRGLAGEHLRAGPEVRAGPLPGARTLHFVGPEPIDRHAFGQLVLRALGRDPSLARPARLAESGLVRPRALVLTRKRTPAWLVAGIRPPRAALLPPPAGGAPPAAPPGDR
jgi:dTDP-4-dehydrorhamnose reductase